MKWFIENFNKRLFYVLIRDTSFFFLQFCLQSSSNFSAEFTIANNLVALLSIGLLFNKCENAGVIELARCVTYVIFAKVNNFTDICVYVVHLFSLCSIWTPYYLKKLIAYNINF